MTAIFPASSSYKDSKKPLTANLEAQYAVRFGSAITPEIELTTTIWPLVCFKLGSAYLVMLMYPIKLTSMIFLIIEEVSGISVNF